MPDRGLVDELGGLRTAIDRAKVLAGFDADAEVKLVGLPGSGLMDMLRPKQSSQPAAASLSDALGGLLGQFGRGSVRAGRADSEPG